LLAHCSFFYDLYAYCIDILHWSKPVHAGTGETQKVVIRHIGINFIEWQVARDRQGLTMSPTLPYSNTATAVAPVIQFISQPPGSCQVKSTSHRDKRHGMPYNYPPNF